MRLTARVSLWVGLGLLSFIGAVTHSAIASAVSIVPTHWPQESPLLITAYQRTSDGQKIATLQLYNDSNQVIDLSKWRITTGDDQTLLLDTSHGRLAPHHHVVISSIVTGASVALSPSPVFTDPNYAQLLLIPSESNYKTTTYMLKSQAINKITYFDDLWQRSMTTTGYSSSVSSFNPTSTQQLFDDGLYAAPTDALVRIVEIYPYSSDCAPNDTSILCSDYVKLYNPLPVPVILDDLVLRTDSSSHSRTSANTISLDGIPIEADSYLTIWLTDQAAPLSLTNSGGYVWIEDAYATARYDHTITRYESAGVGEQGFAWAQTIDGGWQWTTTPQPSGTNVITHPVAESTLSECPAGKYRSPDTNRCRSIEEAVNALATCPEGQTRNPTTNRCRSVATAAATLTPCKEGQERNPATNRCRNISSVLAELLPCDEGYERNLTTNRCRKVTGSDPLSVATGPAGASALSQPFNPYLVAALAFAGGLGYIVYQFRHDIAHLTSRLAGKVSGK